MKKYLAGVLSVIAAGVLPVAYGLLKPRRSTDASTIGVAPFAQAATAADRAETRKAAYGSGSNVIYVPMSQAQGAAQPGFVPVNYVPQQVYAPVAAPATFAQPAPRADAEP